MEKLTVLYGTQTGNAERVALRVSRLALRQGVKSVHCLSADDVPIHEWPRTGGPVVILCSNANQGDAPNSFRRSWASLLQPDTAPAACMTGLQYAVYGLGDSLYLKFNYMAKMLHNRLKQLGGTPLVMRGLGDESDAKGFEETLVPWLAELWEALDLTNGAAPTADLRRPRYPQQDVPYFPLYSVRPFQGTADSLEASPQLLRYAEPVMACEVVSNRRITAASCNQAVHHLELRVCPGTESATASSTYDVGDALGVYCPNRPELVEELLQRLRRDGDEVVVVEPDASHGLTVQPARPFFHHPLTLRSLLRHYIDLDAVVTQEFMWMLAHEVRDDDDNDEDAHDSRERLYELGNPSNVNDYLQYAHREKRNVCEVLHDFKNLNPSLELVLTFATPMLPRYFSLASALSMDGPGRFDVCVGLLDWHTPLKRHRTGLCSSYLVGAQPGSQLTCFVWQGNLALPAAPSPLLCVATGTGIAPIRAVLRQVAGLAAQGWKDVPVVLVFGCRHEAEDYLYREEWADLRAKGLLPSLTVIPAFSRDTDKKIYVQHQLGEHAKLVSSFVQPEEVEGRPLPPGVIYVCGNAKQMPKDVQRTVEQTVEATVPGVEDEAGAAVYVRGLARVGRYQVDSWSA
ncbi:NADPH-cytochrome p450 reductase-like protein [Leptomonas pyrrhocoris]|uniref:NADPH-cytochrome p450 reductase-like protein n=1 Tax=Leptomonas pyrrhocoris TaxID=157538 RepID=A0A0M9G554_LEPPY|nr:NADPH-cytochrome p450 reductase-like protein [Leptomonas pyrrhocoris]KPA82339.1 NADPH-cytochrome p450 reductase-like protein [Leptomonas pyrrhocoris]|eukprot:XP_015660778.1 NADPH-cytochrome p450 reductase-like protein [Leptomonas pyrrhocoris]